MATWVLIFTLLGLSGCGKSSQSEMSGVNDALAFIPEAETGVFTLNFKRISDMDIFKEQLEKGYGRTRNERQ